MVVVGLTALCLGAALARYFSVFVLVPSTVIATASVATIAWLGGHGMLYVALASAIAAFSLQLGYFAGLFVERFFSTKKIAAPAPQHSPGRRGG
jgi:hypothetical protein